MTDLVNLNQAWAGVLVDELVRCGVRRAVVSPGSRSAPLALALHDHTAMDLTVAIDERSGAFHALGHALASGMPGLVVTTSGTAVAELLPAVTEADAAAVPLVVVSADRPPELLDVGANQAIDQTRLFGRRVRWERDLGLPEATPTAFRALRTAACRAASHAMGLRSPAGPVHLNVPLREPLAPVPDDHDGADLVRLAAGRQGGGSWTRISAPHHVADAGDLDRLAGLVARGNGVIIAGPRQVDDGTAALLPLLAADLDTPLLADPLSGARYGPPGNATVIGAYDAFLGDPAVRKRLRPDWILQFGAAPTSKNLQRWIEQHRDVPRIVVDERGGARDQDHSASHILCAHPASIAAGLTDRIEGAGSVPSWRDAFTQADAAARKSIAMTAGEPAIARALVESLPPEALLFVGNSNPVRDLDRYGAPRDASLRVLANRGASGIDGLVSTAAGVASRHEGPCYALLGDLSLQHDLGGLALLAARAPDLRLIVINNGGGAIFDRLPVASAAPRDAYEELFLTPQDVDLAAATQAFRVPHVRCDVEGLFDALAAADGGMIEVQVDRQQSAEARQAEQDGLAAALAQALAAPA